MTCGELVALRPGERVSDYVRRQIKESRIFVGCEGEEPDLAHAVRSVGRGIDRRSAAPAVYPHPASEEQWRRRWRKPTTASSSGPVTTG